MSETDTRGEPDSRASFALHREHLDEFAAQLDAVVDESKLRFEPDGLNSRAVDAANVAMIDVTLGVEAFPYYDGDGEVIGLLIDGLRDALAREVDATAELAVQSEARKFDLALGEAEFSMAYIDPDSVRGEPDLPDIDKQVQVTMGQDRLDAIVEYADTVNDYVVFGFDHDEREFYATAMGATDDLDYRVHASNLDDVTATGDAHSSFALDYLKDAVAAIPEDTPVTIHMDEEFPMMWEYDFGPGGHGHVEYIIAPRIQSGDRDGE